MKEKKDMNRKRAIRARQRKQRNRRIALVLCVMFAVLAASIGGTVAWLTDKTDAITNTFTTSNIDIELTESENLDLKMVPGKTITKDPVATVKANSEACYLFVKVEKSNNYDTFMDGYTIADGWNSVSGVNDVYYRVVPASTTDVSFPILKNNTVTVKTTVTKEMMKELTSAPTLTFTAYAVQKANVDTVEAAWNLAKTL